LDDLVEFCFRERVKILEKNGDDGVSVWILTTGLSILRTQRQLSALQQMLTVDALFNGC